MAPAFKLTVLFLFLSSMTFAQTKEKWVSKPPEQWPQIALVNQVLFKNGDRYVHPSFAYAGTGFLIEYRQDTFAATAKHILWVAKNRQSKFVQINEVLHRWTMKPKTNPGDSAVIDSMLNEDSTEVLEGRGSTILERDWIVFTVKKTTPGLYPLKPRFTTVKPGEKVFMLSCSYNDSACKVFSGTVLRKLGTDILIARNMKDHTGGSSGSPVIDANGYLIGVLSSSSSDAETGKGVSVAISTEYLHEVLNKKPGLNTPRKDYGELIYHTAVQQGAEKAIALYRRLVADPRSYYIYNLRSADRNGLREAGERLLNENQVRDAIRVLAFNADVNSGYYVNHNILAKAHLRAGELEAARRAFKISIQRFDDKNENEAFKELEKIEAKE